MESFRSQTLVDEKMQGLLIQERYLSEPQSRVVSDVRVPISLETNADNHPLGLWHYEPYVATKANERLETFWWQSGFDHCCRAKEARPTRATA